MRKLHPLLLVAACLMTYPASARIWTDASGKYSVEAEFVAFDSMNVQLRKSDGVVISIALSRLSQSDRQFLSQKETTGAKHAAGNSATPSQISPADASLRVEKSFSSDRPSWSIRVTSIKDVGSEIRTDALLATQRLRLRDTRLTLWQVSFEASCRDTAGKYAYLWPQCFQLKYREPRQAAKALNSIAFWDGKRDSILAQNVVIMGAFSSSVLVAGPKDLLNKEQLLLYFLDFTPLEIKPRENAAAIGVVWEGQVRTRTHSR